MEEYKYYPASWLAYHSKLFSFGGYSFCRTNIKSPVRKEEALSELLKELYGY